MDCPSCGIENPVEASFCMSCGISLVVSQEPLAYSPTEIATSSGFVGRQPEMGELKAALDDALSGQGRLVMLTGEPGIGKTRTAQELASYAETVGAQVLWGRCYEEEGAPPYWPWVLPIRSYIQQTTSEQLQSEMGPGAADIAEIVPELRGKLPDLELPPSLEPEQARFRLFDSITTFLKNAAQSQPFLLVLDDLHWADRSSLLLREFVVRAIAGSHLLLVGLYRDTEVSRQHPLSQTLGSLVREVSFQRAQLKGLNREEVGRFVEVASGVSTLPGLVEAVHARTEGNPLFIGEVVRLLQREGLEEDRAWNVRIPEGLRDAISRRLNQLSDQCNQALTVASVIGREFNFRELGLLIEEMTEDRILEVLEEARTARVIEELPREVGRYQFSHALIQETLADELSTTRRVRLHARIVQALEELYGDDAETHAAELAYHVAEAEAVLGSEKLVHYSRLAGEQALAVYAHDEALRHFECALVAKQIALTGREPAKDAEVARLVFGLGCAHAGFSTRDMQEAINVLGRAFDYYAEAGDADLSVAIAEYPLPVVAGRRTGMAGPIARALELVPPDSHQAGRLLSRYGQVMGRQEGDYGAAKKAFERAVTIAQHQGDIALEFRTLAHASYMDYFHLNWDDSLEKGRRATELTQRVADPYAAVMTHLGAAMLFTTIGDARAAPGSGDSMPNGGRTSACWILAGRGLFLPSTSVPTRRQLGSSTRLQRPRAVGIGCGPTPPGRTSTNRVRGGGFR
ncbi:MAG: AAA family ATPase [Dehalococcoidia bacterium]